MKTSRTHRRLTPLVAGAISAIVVGGGVLAIAAPQPFHNNHTAGLALVGPIDDSPTGGGFPISYTDTNGVRLEICLDTRDPFCIPAPLPDPAAPMSFPENFPEEAFWWSGEAVMDTVNGGEALLVLANEAAFATGDPAVGQGVSFGRVRIRVDNLVEGDYVVTHPYGVDEFAVGADTANDDRSINSTEDVGDLAGGSDFTGILGSRVGPYLVWDDSEPAPPAGYLGDPTVPHAVTGSPYDTNFFRITGPAGAFTGSASACPGITDGSCIETNLFNVQAKKATRAGIQASRVDLVDDGDSRFVDVFAFSTADQEILVKGTGITQTLMRGANGKYFVRVPVTNGIPADLVLVNRTDHPDTMSRIVTTDHVHISDAEFDNDHQQLTVSAFSSEAAAALSLSGFTSVSSSQGSDGSVTFVVDGVEVPPPFVTVTSSGGGSDTDDVVIAGGANLSEPVGAVIASIPTLQLGQAITLDGTGSTGTVANYAWEQTSGPSLAGLPVSNADAGTIVVVPSATGTYGFRLTVTGLESGNESATEIFVEVVGVQPPAAAAGDDLTGIVPSSLVTLDGTGSLFTTSYAWTQTGGPAVTLTGANTANPSFVAPVNAGPLTFTLTASGPGGAPSTDTVMAAMNLDDVTLDAGAFYKAGNTEWRMSGTAEHCLANNIVTITWNLPATAPAPQQRIVGTAATVLAGGTCTWEFRIKDAPANLRPTAATQGTITISSSLGGFRPNQSYARR